jgi:hypothetical protein
VGAGFGPLHLLPLGRNGRGSPRGPFHPGLRRICIRFRPAILAREAVVHKAPFPSEAADIVSD